MINYNRKQNRENAQRHDDLVRKLFTHQITDSLKQTKVYDHTNLKPDKGTSKPEIAVWGNDTYSAAIKAFKAFKHQKIAVLNFADYVNAGGGYLNGSMAQEEAICGQNNLYPIISECKDYYAYNSKHMNYGLYLDRALYTPNVLWGISRVPQAKTDVITCAAPRKSRGKYIKNPQKQAEYYNDANASMQKRMEFVKGIAESENVDTLILGAWGAGAFGFDAREVAEMWQKAFSGTSTIKNVIFAIIDDKRSNSALKSFKDVFNK